MALSAIKAPRIESPAVPAVLLAAGFLLRLAWSAWSFLNPDEAAHYLLSVQPSVALAYKASLTTAHPPLLIILLHYWQAIGSSEIVLRLPSVVAGAAFCWLTFRWMERVTERNTAVIALALLLFSPSLVSLSAEIRQYSLLLMFSACSLYLLERAIGEDSPVLMVGSCVAVYLAMLSHYSALILALTLGIYGMLRLYSARSGSAITTVWASGQGGGIALAAFLYMTHVSKLKDRNLPQQIADTWLRSSIFHRGEENLLAFIAKANIRVFHFDFGNNVIGIVGLVLFAVGIFLLFREGSAATDCTMPSRRLLGTLLLLPFAINCVLAIAGIYPYGGTRHNALLAGFAICGASVGASGWRGSWSWLKPWLVLAAVLICNLFPSPAGAYIRPKNQDRRLMAQAASFLQREIPSGSVVLTDYQSGLLLSYYVCNDKVVQFEPPFSNSLKSKCGRFEVISTFPRIWIFGPNTFPEALAGIPSADRETNLWVFQAGWLVNDEPQMRKKFEEYGCRAPQSFGENIFLCKLEPR